MRLILILFCSAAILGAHKIVKTYYDPMHLHVEEEYVASATDGQTLDGAYRKYFESGKLALEGTFKGGVRWGTFYEYHENGTLIRKIDYENGLRHGSVAVYDPQGHPIQSAFYQNNKLVDSVKSYFLPGF
ncbi:MAG: hypothetical protein IPJ20_17485 [Flammeovirgaceae bacterium]|nr:hypothetical protein [Flammeovirgaceae bacterium]